MKLEELPAPAPGEGQILVQIEAAGVNFIDIYQRSGAYRTELPFSPGLEGAGKIVSLGEGVTGFKTGERVAWAGVPASYATHALVPADRAIRLPSGVGSREGAAIMLQGMTAHYLARSTYPLTPNDTCLVHAAAGGVGQLLCQIAAMCGTKVIGTVSTEEKARLAREAGAGEVILYAKQDFEDEVKRITNGRGVQVVYDSVGKDTFEKSLNCLAPRGFMVLYGQSSGAVPPFDPQMLSAKGSLYLTRPTLAAYTKTRETLQDRANDLFGWIGNGRLKLRIGGTYPLSDAAQAHRDLAARRTTGKLLLIP
jgi:NADPH2:quinone reductase